MNLQDRYFKQSKNEVLKCMYSEINLDIEKPIEFPTFKLMFCQSVSFFKDTNTAKKKKKKKKDLPMTKGNCSAEIPLHYRL